MRRRRLALVASVLILLGTPLWIFARQAAPLPDAVWGDSPPGQAAYLMMRPAGHLAFCLLFLQILLGLHRRLLESWAGLPDLLPLHRALAIPTLTLALLHPMLHAWATTLRTGQGTLGATLFPDPTMNALTFYFFFGALALYGALTAALAALAGPRLLPRGWRLVHGLVYPSFFLAWYHASALGAEVRDQPLQAAYTLMAAAVAAMLISRFPR